LLPRLFFPPLPSYELEAVPDVLCIILSRPPRQDASLHDGPVGAAAMALSDRLASLRDLGDLSRSRTPGDHGEVVVANAAEVATYKVKQQKSRC